MSNEILIFNVPSQEVGIENPSVSSVNGKAGVVRLTQDDIPDGETYVQYSKAEREKVRNIDASLVGVSLDKIINSLIQPTVEVRDDVLYIDNGFVPTVEIRDGVLYIKGGFEPTVEIVDGILHIKEMKYELR